MKVYEDIYCGVCDLCGRPIVDRDKVAIEDFYVYGHMQSVANVTEKLWRNA